MTCKMGEVREIGGKLMECVPERTKGRMYRKGCYWVYTEKPKTPVMEQSDYEYYERIGKEAKAMERCLELGGYWLGTSCYFGGEEKHPPVTPPLVIEPGEERKDKQEGEACGGAIGWLGTAISGGTECAEGLKCIGGVCQKESITGKFSKGIKTSLWSIGLFGVLLIGLLIALGYSQMGGVVAHEHKRKRG
jgi:hypothetical protein